jgi:glycine cleavage system protein P-like pyridoxal-binding family
MQAGRNGRYSQKTRTFSAKAATYPSTIGVWEDRSEIALFIRGLDNFLKMAGAEMGQTAFRSGMIYA